MPCRDDFFDRAANNYETDNRELKELNNELQERLDLVTRLLCGTLTSIKEDQVLAQDLMNNIDGLYDWWMQHQEDDRKRHQAKVASAKSKLSKEELEALVKELKNNK